MHTVIPSLEKISPEQANTLLHELQVHQIELESQNEELRRTQIELDLIRERYFDLYDLAPVGYLTLNDTEIISESNLTAANLLGLSGKKLVGRPIRNFILPADQDIYHRHRQLLAKTGEPQTCELRMAKKGSSPFWAQLMATLGQDATGGVAHRLVLTNIDERKQVKDRLRISDSALKAITQGVLIITPEMTVVSANAAFLAMTGYTEAELIGQSSMIFIGQQTDSSMVQGLLEAIAQQRKFSCEVFNYRKDGHGFWNELSVSPVFDAQHRLSHFVGINTDISERKQMDQRLQLKNLQLQAATRLAEQANVAKSEFLSNMSHELRSPLNAIVGFAQLLESGSPPPTALQQRNIGRILAGGWYLLKLINEILDLAVIESGKLALTLQPLEIGPLLLECKHLTAPQVEKQGIHLKFPNLTQHHWVIADPTRLKQVMVNLLSNAIKYNRPGGEVDVSVHQSQNGYLRINVKDTGEGLSADKLEKLFTSFNRLGRESGNTEGTGIGLVVTKRLTEMMGGQVGVQSSVGVGSEFWVEFKSAQSPPADLHKVPLDLQVLNLPDTLPQTPFTVLYVEDDPVNITLVEQILERRDNVQLRCVSDGPQGIAMARLHRPHVILMDINLPGMSGLEALRILRQDPLTRHIPVIAISANAMPLDVVKGLSEGFTAYLTKPFQIDHFMTALDKALRLALHIKAL